MNILQFESLNLEFICKRYEINKFWNSKYKIRSKSMINKKKSGVCLKENKGLRVKLRDNRLVFDKPRVSLAKLPLEKVSGCASHSIHDRRPGLEQLVRARARGLRAPDRWAWGGLRH